MTILEAALKYASMGFSVIPVLPPKKGADGKDENKKAIIKWEPFQKKAAEPELIKQWWLKWPDARIGIVCGKVSDLAVVDCDSEEAKKAVDELIPDSLTVPIAKTPRGGYHYWFKNDGKLATGTGAMPNVDIRAEGGMIIASPSAGLNGNGYRWLISPLKAAIPIIPIKLCTVLISSSSLLLSSSSLAHGDKETVHARSKLNFAEGHRDDTLWHIGHCLTKGGMAKEQMEQLLEILGLNVCNPPFPMNEIKAKVSSILKRSEDGEKNLSQDVLEWICRQSGVFMSSDVVNELDLSSRVAKKNLSKILNRFCEPEHGHIEKSGKKRGCFRVIDRSYQEQKWWNDEGIPLPVKFPLGVEEFAKVFPGNIVLLEGQKSQGKSAFALEFCRMNKGLFSKKTMYQNVEMSDSELIDRFRAYGDIMSFNEWKENVLFIRQTSDWWDKIIPDGLNVVDYLIEYKEPYLLADYVFEIHKKLTTGICLLVVQRDPFKQYPAGGRAVRDIPRLIISLIKHRLKLEDVKSFHQTAYGNPTGLSRKYKQVSWWNFRADTGWELEMEKKNVEY